MLPQPVVDEARGVDEVQGVGGVHGEAPQAGLGEALVLADDAAEVAAHAVLQHQPQVVSRLVPGHHAADY